MANNITAFLSLFGVIFVVYKGLQLGQVSCTVINTREIDTKIVNGKPAEINDHPYQISLQIKRATGTSHMCGGSIISENFILTAAHCVYNNRNPKLLSVVSGSTKLSAPKFRTNVKNIIVHEGYAPVGSLENDVALIEVEKPFEFSISISPISLPDQGIVAPGDAVAVATGWGSLQSPMGPFPDHLQSVNLKIVDYERCKNIMPDDIEIHPNSHVCAFIENERIGVCSGDSGGPLVLNGEVIGIASWIIPDSNGYCGNPKYPSVFTRVSGFSDWLHKHLNEV